MTVIVFRAGKPVDALELQKSLVAMGIKTWNIVSGEEGENPVVETKKRLFRVTDRGLEDVGSSEIIIASPGISLDIFPENMSFGNGVTVSGDIVWIVVDPKLGNTAISRLPDIEKLLE
jgi:hypothetical protein